MEKIFEVTVKYNKKDFWRMYFDYYFNQSTLFYMFFGSSIFGIVLLFIFVGTEAELFDLLLIFGLGIIFSLIYSFVLTYYSVAYAEKLKIKDVKFAFYDDGLEMVSSEFESRIKWNYLLSAKETEHYFFLINKSNEKYTLPKRAFEDSEQIIGFKNLLFETFGEKADLKKTKLGLK